MKQRQLVETWDIDPIGVTTKLLVASLALSVGVLAAPQVSSWLSDLGPGGPDRVARADTRGPAGSAADAAEPAARRTAATASAAPTVETEPAVELGVETAVTPGVETAVDAAFTPAPSPVRPDVEGPVAAPPATGSISPYVGAAPGPRAADGRWHVLYVGDSLAYETEQHVRQLLDDDVVELMTFGGTAPCDWVGKVTERAVTFQPDLVVVSFLGNNGTPCTGHAVGDDLLSAYERDLSAMCDAVVPARCVLAGQPTVPEEVGWTMPAGDQPTTMYRSQAEAGRWGFVDAGASVETADGRFDQALRNPDRVHFSDEGAWRYAATIAGFVAQLRS